MKFEDLLMQPGEERQTRQQLQEEVEKLQQVLDEEVQLKRVLQCALQGPFGCCPSCSCLSYFLPFKVQVLLTELAIVEEEIDWLERKVNELKLDIYQEKQQIRERELKELHPQWQERRLAKLSSRRPMQIEDGKSVLLIPSQNSENSRYRTERGRREPLGSSIHPANFLERHDKGEESVESRCSKGRINHTQLHTETEIGNPNKLSIELIKCLTDIFLNLNQETFKSKIQPNLTKNTLICINSKGLVSKATFSCKTAILPFNHNDSHFDPYGILPESDLTIRDIGPYKNFIQITQSTLDASHLADCLPAVRRLRILMQVLSEINITNICHKQKLAFWINIHNACVMHAFLQHGLPSTQEKLLTLMNKASITVGGAVLSALTIENFILRHPAEVKNESIEGKEMVLRHVYGLSYPEPNVTFALCRGSWSSPALRFYTPDEVMNELEEAKVEYLEASVGITNKKILVPKIMHLHMKDFADDMESLLEWIYSQLPYTSSLKRLIMECLNGQTQCPLQKLIDIQPYSSEFRYLLPR